MSGGLYVDVPRSVERSKGSITAAIVAVADRLHATLVIWRTRARLRRSLAHMSERELADIGVSWPQIAEEINKPFWRA